MLESVRRVKEPTVPQGAGAEGRRPSWTRSRMVLCLVSGLVLAGCTHGAPELQQLVQNHRFAPDSNTVAFAISSRWVRQASGLAAFPDGGTPRTVAEVAAVYACDVATLAVRRLWVAQRPDGFRTGFTPWLGMWTDAGLFVSLIDAGAPTSVEPTPTRRRDFLITAGGVVTEVPAAPPVSGVATSEPPGCAEAVRREIRMAPPVGQPGR